MAALWKLPVIYVVENNLYAMGTSLARSSAVLDLTVRGAVPYGIPGFSINGNDIELMAKTTREAANRARAGEGPTFIEAQTYRYKGHSISDPGKYRLKDELDSAVRNDPIVVYREHPQAARLDRPGDDRPHAGERQAGDRGEHRVRRAERAAAPRRPLRRHHGGPVHPTGVNMSVISFREALNQAMTEEMERDESVFLMGEEVAEYDGAYKVSQGMLKRFGPRRVVDTPISEEGFAGIGIGAAMAGLRPIIEFMTFSFSLVAIDQIVNNAANMRYMSGGQFAVPIVFRGSSGMAGCLAATHSHRLEAWYAQIPGLTVILPATPADAKGLLKSAIRSDDPVVFIEHEVLYHDRGEVPDGEHLVPIGKADIKRPGSDVTLITYSRSLKATLAAAEKLAEEEIDAEVIDLRTIRPLDLDTLLASVSQDPPRRDRRGGLALLRPRRRDLRPDHAGRLRRARRADPPRGRQGCPDPVQPGARGLDAPLGRPGRRRGPRCPVSLISVHPPRSRGELVRPREKRRADRSHDAEAQPHDGDRRDRPVAGQGRGPDQGRRRRWPRSRPTRPPCR